MSRINSHNAFDLRRLIDEYADALLSVDAAHPTQEQAAQAAERYREALSELNAHIINISGSRAHHTDGGWCRISRPGMFSDVLRG